MRVCFAQTRPDRRGAVIVETALLLPVFVLLSLGIIEFGRGLKVGEIVTSAAREGARSAIVVGSTSESVIRGVKSQLHDALGVDPADVNVAVTVEPAARTGEPASDLANAQPSDLCRVEISVPYDKVGCIAGRYLQSANVRAVCALRHE